MSSVFNITQQEREGERESKDSVSEWKGGGQRGVGRLCGAGKAVDSGLFPTKL